MRAGRQLQLLSVGRWALCVLRLYCGGHAQCLGHSAASLAVLRCAVADSSRSLSLTHSLTHSLAVGRQRRFPSHSVTVTQSPTSSLIAVASSVVPSVSQSVSPVRGAVSRLFAARRRRRRQPNKHSVDALLPRESTVPTSHDVQLGATQRGCWLLRAFVYVGDVAHAEVDLFDLFGG